MYAVDRSSLQLASLIHSSACMMNLWHNEDVLTVNSSKCAAACALLGRQVDSKTYIKGDECLDSLKDLQQFLHRDDPVGEIDQVPIHHHASTTEQD